MNELNARDWLLRRQLRTAQIIAGSLVAGVGCYLGFVLLVLQPAANNGPAAPPMLSYIAAGGFVVALLMSRVVPGVMVNQQVARIAADGAAASQADGGDTVRLLALYQTRVIVADALLEGAAFFAAAAHMIEREPFTAAIAGFAVFLMLLTFPTCGRMESWLDLQQARVDQLRQFGRM